MRPASGMALRCHETFPLARIDMMKSLSHVLLCTRTLDEARRFCGGVDGCRHDRSTDGVDAGLFGHWASAHDA